MSAEPICGGGACKITCHAPDAALLDSLIVSTACEIAAPDTGSMHSEHVCQYMHHLAAKAHDSAAVPP